MTSLNLPADREGLKQLRALDGKEPVPAGRESPMSRVHIRYLLQEARLGAADLDVLALQLTAALDGPVLLYLSGAQDSPEVAERLGQGWEDLVRRVCRPGQSA